ncbi:HAD family hydrolase [Sulfitobacter sp. D35]|uniref:HAD family hydrolase n=1 Tax=Sulfitobacter sp. D35 TaxID=3083252 RepID=UPI00296F5368|nr:HAD family hydrolase [Sulfitobacter sp. D35]MDW4497262.1 HAD family hydrolase [Sulfitobacter sp. D35]
MPQSVTTVGFDADDTLWHNERYFQLTQERFAGLLADFTDPESLTARLEAAERRNLGHYGFGIKGFTLSMIETAIEVTGGRVSARVISELLAAGREMLEHPVDLLPHARTAVEAARETHKVLLITKGDLLDQERKLAQSGLGELFDGVEIVSEKSDAVYAEIFTRHADGAARGLMVGNSLRSDVLPMIAAGGWGAYVPHDLTWAVEHAEPPEHPRFAEIRDLAGLSALLDRLG